MVSVIVCSVVPSWRRYALAAVVAPIAFAGCAITGMMAIILSAEAIGLAGTVGFNQPWQGTIRDYIGFSAAFVLPGLVGAFVAVFIANRLQRWYLAHRL